MYQFILAIGFLTILGALTDPFMYWMPPSGIMVTLVLAAALAALWAGLVMRERGGDERDVHHRLFAGRAAYLMGFCALTAALVIQGLDHAIDPWIPVTLAIMVVAKVAAGWFADRYQ